MRIGFVELLLLLLIASLTIGPSAALWVARWLRRANRASAAAARRRAVQEAQRAAEREEVLLAAYVDGAGRVLKCEEIARGGHARVQVDSYKSARGALMAGAAGVALAHNHPNGTPTPSQEDFDMTDRLQRTLSELGLELVDHCVVARSNFTSIGRLRSGSLRKRY